MPEEKRYRRDRQRNRDRDKKKEQDDGKKIILAKKEPSVKANTPEPSSSQPKLLLKPKEAVKVEQISKPTPSISPLVEMLDKSKDSPQDMATGVTIQTSEDPIMTKPEKLLTSELAFNSEAIPHIYPYIQDQSNDFHVVAFVGPQNCGKSTLANILLNPLYNLNDLQKSDKSIFQMRSRHHMLQLEPVTEGIDIFITKERLMVLDCAPLLSNVSYKDYISSELDDLKTLAFLLKVCNLVVLLQENYINPNIVRLIHTAEMMRIKNSSTDDEHLAQVMLVENKCRQMDKEHTKQMKSLYKTIFHNSNINCYYLQSMNEEELKTVENINYLSIPNLKDTSVQEAKQIIDNFRMQVLMSKRYATKHNQVTQFSEKSWMQSLSKTWEAQYDAHHNYFFKKYGNLKEKFNLLNHVSINDGIKCFSSHR